ncbi:TRAM domain-containing protein [Halospeciosus flavus]|uniref:TRAM domain-containing protein n=1 Tax=Halospeciosus flavus TaxID=3032283 RepID=A0ABD5Z0Y1_9EURY
MVQIPDSLQTLYNASIEEDGDRYVLPVPAELVEKGSVSAGETYRIALLESLDAAEQSGETATESVSVSERKSESADESSSQSTSTDTSRQSGGRQLQSPPVEEGEVRTVTIDTLGDQGDGIAKIDRGFVVIVPGTKPGDQVEVEITDVKETVAFADPIGEATVR